MTCAVVSLLMYLILACKYQCSNKKCTLFLINVLCVCGFFLSFGSVPEPPAELLSHEDKMSVALTSTIGTQTGTGSIHRSTFTQTSEEDATSS